MSLRGAALLCLALRLATPGSADGASPEACAASSGVSVTVGSEGNAALLQSKTFTRMVPFTPFGTEVAAAPPAAERAVSLLEVGGGGGLASAEARAWAEVAARAEQGRAFIQVAQSVRLAAAELAASQNVTVTEISDLVTRFINNQASSTDKCPAQLMEAKHQLNELHVHIGDLAQEVNATEKLMQIADMNLKETLDKIRQADEWKDGELAKCDKKRAEDTKMWLTLQDEMREMQQIARPNASMSIAGKRVGAFKPLLLQVGSSKPNAEVSEVQKLVQTTRDAAASMAACMQKSGPHEPSALVQLHARKDVPSKKADFPNCSADATVKVEVGGTSTSYTVPREIADADHAPYPCVEINGLYKGMFWVNCAKGVLAVDVGQCLHRGDSPAECAEQKQKLEKQYVTTYVELARLVAEFEDLANSTACHDAVWDGYKTRKAPLSAEASKLTEEMMDFVKALESLRPKLADTTSAHGKLAKQIDELTEKCAQLPETTSDLHLVRKAINALSLCPGLERAEFVIPEWTGQWVSVDEIDGLSMSDDEIDSALNLACIAKFGGKGREVRAAGTSEIAAVSIELMPRNNTAQQPLMGTCPHCAGDLDGEDTPKHKSGHARICWDPEAKLKSKFKRTDCSSGSKVALCVYERGNIRAYNLTMPTVNGSTTHPETAGPAPEAAKAEEPAEAEEPAKAEPPAGNGTAEPAA